MFLIIYLMVAFVLLFTLPGISILMVLGGSVLYGGYTILKMLFGNPAQTHIAQAITPVVENSQSKALPMIDHSKETEEDHQALLQAQDQRREEELLHRQAVDHQHQIDAAAQSHEEQLSWQERLENGYRP